MTIPEVKISLKWKNKKYTELASITGSQTAADILRKMFDSDHMEWKEEVILLCLNRANKIIGYSKISSGGYTGCVVDPKVIFLTALKTGATAIILSHNHPSGNLDPSAADREITYKLRDAGKVLDLNLIDHIIITDEGYYSFADEGLI